MLISLVFLSCMAVVYLGAWRGRADTVTVAAIGALCVEGVLVLLGGGNCPLGPLLRRLGDETPFFELFLPPPSGQARLTILAAVCVLGAVLLAIRTLYVTTQVSHPSAAIASSAFTTRAAANTRVRPISAPSE
jgi:hypothetical protein